MITNTAYGWIESDPITVQEGQRYQLSTFIQGRIDPDGSRDGGTWVVRVSWFDQSGERIGYDNTASGDPSSLPTTWAQVGGEATAPVGAVTAKLRIYLYMGSGWINIDDVTFTPIPSETLLYSLAGETVALRKDGDLHWMITDHLGSTATMYKADGTETPQHQYYHPWGNLRGSTEPQVELPRFGRQWFGLFMLL